MRLSKNEIDIIKSTIYEMDKNCKIYLFGSRVDDNKKGGDIDLLVISSSLTVDDAKKIKYRLWDYLGEQKIDILIERDMSHPFTRIALKEAVLL